MKLSWQLWLIFDRHERLQGLFLLLGLAFGALLEAGSIALVAPFLAALSEPKRIFDIAFFKPILSALKITDASSLLTVLGSALVAAFALKTVYLIAIHRLAYRWAFEKHVSLSRQLLSSYLGAAYIFHLQRNSAEVLKNTETIQRFILGFLLMLLVVLGEVLVVVTLTTLLMIYQPIATVVAVVVLAGPVVLLYRLMQRRLSETGHIAERSMASMIQWSDQAIGGIKEILLLDRASYFVGKHSFYARQYADSWRSFTLMSNIPRMVIDTVAVTALVLISLAILARGQDVQSVLPMLGLFAVAAIRLMPSVNRIAHGLTQLRFHYVTIEVLHDELWATQQSVAETVQVGPARKPLHDIDDAAGLFSFERSVVFDRLTYCYPTMPVPAVVDVSLEIPIGQWAAFVGPTGAGKTTLVDLMLGLLAPTSGSILVDGHDIVRHMADWRRSIGYMPQDVYLIDDTIRRNIAFGLPDDEIDDEQIWHALRAAHFDAGVRSLPGRLDATVGQRGDRLAGGERQRLGLARALYRDPPVLVVDEGTANLDNETEAAIANTLASLRGRKTIIVIAHRLALVRESDRVYLMRGGRLQTSGGYAELLASDAGFRQFTRGAA